MRNQLQNSIRKTLPATLQSFIFTSIDLGVEVSTFILTNIDRGVEVSTFILT